MKSAFIELVALAAMTLLAIDDLLLLFTSDYAFILVSRLFLLMWAAGETMAMLVSAGSARAYRAPAREAIALLTIVSNGLLVLTPGLQPRGAPLVLGAIACSVVVVLEWTYQRKRYPSMQSLRALLRQDDKNAPYDW